MKLLNDIIANSSRKTLLFTSLSALCILSAPILAFTPGKDGNVTIIASNTVVNDVTTMSQNATAGDNRVRQSATSNTLGLTVGDLILIYQANGATITTANDYTYGSISNLQGAGQYEFATVTSVPIFTGPGSGQRYIGISTACGGLENTYTVAQGAVQIIRVPQYNNLTINNGNSIVPPTWNGTTGGVVAMHVNGTLNLNSTGSINASARGFRGGAAFNSGAPNGRTEYSTTDSDFGAAKGEGVALNVTARGRGAAANGGGGGVSHNSGGGGGANGNNGNPWTIGAPVNGGQGVMNPTYAAGWALDPSYAQNGNALTNSSGGGRGGYSWSRMNQDPTIVPPGDDAWGNENGPNYDGDARREIGGLGGRPLNNLPASRIFMGGGGGAGHGNNNVSGAGGNGGGIVFIMANQVTGSGTISSNGGNGGNASTTAPNDAPGGAGAGGTIIVRANNMASSVNLSAVGGNGGNQLWASTADDEAEGPGGGGGGGYIAVLGGTPTRTAAGGAAGIANKTFMTSFPTNGASEGATGQATESVNFVKLCAGTITGRVFIDIDGDGVLDFNEVGISGVEITITPASGSPFTLTTDADGFYNALAPTGLTTALVNVADPDIPAGSTITSIPLGGTPSQSRTLTEASASSTVNVGFVNDVLLVELLDFSAYLDSKSGLVRVDWVTAAEYGTAGFDVYRIDEPIPGTKQAGDTKPVKINDDLINPLGSPVDGAIYSLFDPKPWEDGERRSYILVETEFSGKQLSYGPVYYPETELFESTNVNDWIQYED